MRIIARLDVKNEYVIKGIQMEGLRKIGNPNEMASGYYNAGIDEIFFIDCVASLYGRNNLFDVIRRASEEVFVPITIGGGIRSLDDVKQALDAGADKVAINTAAVRSPLLITEIARQYGSQCVVASIQAKQVGGGWEAYVDTGREKTGLSVVDWSKRVEELGAGELLLTSVDRDGTKKGFDVSLATAVNEAVGIPVVLSGGYGAGAHFAGLFAATRPSGLCFSTALHYGLTTPHELKAGVQAASLARAS